MKIQTEKRYSTNPKRGNTLSEDTDLRYKKYKKS